MGASWSELGGWREVGVSWSKLEQAGRLERARSKLEQAGRLDRAGSKLGVSWSEGSELGGRGASFNLAPTLPIAP